MLAKRISLFAVVLFLVPSSVVAVPLSGTLTEYWFDFRADIDPIDIQFGGTTASTGPITVVLDTSSPLSARAITFDFDSMTHHFSFPALVSAPLFTKLGDPIQRLLLSFAGPITVTPNDLIPGVPTDILIDFIAHGSGTFGPDELLAGWTYENIRNSKTNGDIEINAGGVVVKVPVTVQTNVKGTMEGQLKNPDGSKVVPIVGRDTGRISSIPEPSSIALFFAGLLGLMIKLRLDW